MRPVTRVTHSSSHEVRVSRGNGSQQAVRLNDGALTQEVLAVCLHVAVLNGQLVPGGVNGRGESPVVLSEPLGFLCQRSQRGDLTESSFVSKQISKSVRKVA